MALQGNVPLVVDPELSGGNGRPSSGGLIVSRLRNFGVYKPLITWVIISGVPWLSSRVLACWVLLEIFYCAAAFKLRESNDD